MGNPSVYNNTTNKIEYWSVFLNIQWKLVSDLPAQQFSSCKRPKLFQILYLSSPAPESPEELHILRYNCLQLVGLQIITSIFFFFHDKSYLKAFFPLYIEIAWTVNTSFKMYSWIDNLKQMLI